MQVTKMTTDQNPRFKLHGLEGVLALQRPNSPHSTPLQVNCDRPSRICQGFSLHHQAALPLGRRLRRRLGRRAGPAAPRELLSRSVESRTRAASERRSGSAQAGRWATGQPHCATSRWHPTQPSRVRFAGLRPPLTAACFRLTRLPHTGTMGIPEVPEGPNVIGWVPRARLMRRYAPDIGPPLPCRSCRLRAGNLMVGCQEPARP